MLNAVKLIEGIFENKTIFFSFLLPSPNPTPSTLRVAYSCTKLNSSFRTGI